MGYELRGIDPGVPMSSGQMAENDKHITEYVYNDVSGNLQVGMPVYVDVRDSGEWNNRYSGTALSPVQGATGGRVVLGATAAGTGANLVCVGVFYSDDQNATPAQYSVIRVVDRGRTLIRATAKTGGTPVLVGDVLTADTTPGNTAISTHNTRAAGITIGVATATGTAVAAGSPIIAVPGAGATTQLINGFVSLC